MNPFHTFLPRDSPATDKILRGIKFRQKHNYTYIVSQLIQHYEVSRPRVGQSQVQTQFRTYYFVEVKSLTRDSISVFVLATGISKNQTDPFFTILTLFVSLCGS